MPINFASNVSMPTVELPWARRTRTLSQSTHIWIVSNGRSASAWKTSLGTSLRSHDKTLHDMLDRLVPTDNRESSALILSPKVGLTRALTGTEICQQALAVADSRKKRSSMLEQALLVWERFAKGKRTHDGRPTYLILFEQTRYGWLALRCDETVRVQFLWKRTIVPDPNVKCVVLGV